MSLVSSPISRDSFVLAVGDMVITDAQLLIRPAVPGQYPFSARHDTAHAYRVLSLNNDMGAYSTHIVTSDTPTAAQELLDRVFSAYTEACYAQLDCDLFVSYIYDGRTLFFEEYGIENGSYTMRFYVHCVVTDPEALVAKLKEDITSDTPLIVVRPDDSPDGYRIDRFMEASASDDTDPADTTDIPDVCDACGYTPCQCVFASEEDDDYGHYDEPPYDYDDDDNEDPLAGDVDPTGGYHEEPPHPRDAHLLEVMRQHGDYTG